MKRIAIVAMIAAALSSCVSTGSVDTAIRQSLPQICAAAETGHAVFVALIPTGKLKEKTIAREAAAYSQLEVYCANRDSATLASTLVSAATAYAVITTALREARAAQ